MTLPYHKKFFNSILFSGFQYNATYIIVHIYTIKYFVLTLGAFNFCNQLKYYLSFISILS